MTQDHVFYDGESDAWFQRNKQALENSNVVDTIDPVLALILLAGLTPEHAIEIGASNGYRLHGLHQRYGSHVTAVEPSSAAIADGQARYPEVEFLRGVASHIPVVRDGAFDLAIVNFVFHWIDRATLLRSVAEVDRMVADGGYLVIGDFYPAQPQRISYHHLPNEDIWTYKQDYAAMFLASNLYTLVLWHTLDHSEHLVAPAVVPGERTYVVLLRKTVHERYQSVQFRP
jgi:SAM-dependent methyltransferase